MNPSDVGVLFSSCSTCPIYASVMAWLNSIFQVPFLSVLSVGDTYLTFLFASSLDLIVAIVSLLILVMILWLVFRRYCLRL